jgi:hypothetical protein
VRRESGDIIENLLVASDRNSTWTNFTDRCLADSEHSWPSGKPSLQLGPSGLVFYL